MIVPLTLTLIGSVVLLAILMATRKIKSVQGWPLVAVGWVGSALAMLGNKLLRPEMDVDSAILAVIPTLCIITALPLLAKKYGKTTDKE
jgi:hypothetical protein